jgi:GxxExxY protein
MLLFSQAARAMFSREVILRKEVYAIVGAALEVMRGLGHGIHEKPYEKAMAIELELRGLPYQQQARFDIVYKHIKVGEYIPDLIVFDQIIVDAKVIDKISDHERGQMINYLKITRLRLGILLNFKYAKLQWERVVLSE